MDMTCASDTVKPRIIQRSNGEWLAVAPKSARFSIGVTAPTQDQAGEKFRSVYNEWVSLLDEKALDVPK